MARVVAKQTVGTPRLSLDLRRERRKGIAKPCGRSGAHDAPRRTLQRVGIERLGPALSMLSDRVIRETLELRRRVTKLPIPARIAVDLREDGRGERVLLGLGKLGNGS
jgi:hypothetical protein